MLDPTGSFRLPILFGGLSALLHFAAPIAGAPMTYVLGGLIYAVIIYGLALNWRWLAYIAFLIFGVSISGAISNLGVPGMADWWVYATTASNALAFLSLFAALWRSRPAPKA